jgi:hypothetical protein
MNFLKFGPKRNATIAEPPFNLNRAKIRLEGLGHYASVSVLLLNAALRLFSATPKKLEPKEKAENIVKLVFVASIATTVILGAYTSTVFSLLSLYSKTFLGMGMDDAYMEFFEVTADVRKSAFVSFVGTILSFFLSFLLSLYLQYEGAVRFWITSITAVAIAICVQQWFLIMKYASVVFE